MNTRAVLIILGLLGGQLTAVALAGVVILDNHTAGKVAFTIRQPGDKEKQQTLAAGDLTPISTQGPVEIAFDAGGRQRRGLLQPNSIYYFVDRDKKIDLVALALPVVGDRDFKDGKPRQVGTPPALQPLCTIPVEILVDDAEPTVRAVWEKRLRGRLTAASDIFERHCRVRFEVAAVDMWASDKNIRDFGQSLEEFERKVQPSAGRLAIGFTGRYKWAPGEAHAGGIRGPLRLHILIRNALWDVTESERLEFLVHELGHYLGAVHVSDEDSVMRPKLGDQQARARSFRIGFDAPNTLAMYLLGEELRARPVSSLFDLSPETKAHLRSVYSLLAKSLPDDPAAPKYMVLLDYPPPSESRRGGPRD